MKSQAVCMLPEGRSHFAFNIPMRPHLFCLYPSILSTPLVESGSLGLRVIKHMETYISHCSEDILVNSACHLWFENCAYNVDL